MGRSRTTNIPRLTGEKDDPAYRVWVEHKHDNNTKLGDVMVLPLQIGYSQFEEAVKHNFDPNISSLILTFDPD